MVNGPGEELCSKAAHCKDGDFSKWLPLAINMPKKVSRAFTSNSSNPNLYPANNCSE